MPGLSIGSMPRRRRIDFDAETNTAPYLGKFITPKKLAMKTEGTSFIVQSDSDSLMAETFCGRPLGSSSTSCTPDSPNGFDCTTLQKSLDDQNVNADNHRRQQHQSLDASFLVGLHTPPAAPMKRGRLITNRIKILRSSVKKDRQRGKPKKEKEKKRRTTRFPDRISSGLGTGNDSTHRGHKSGPAALLGTKDQKPMQTTPQNVPVDDDACTNMLASFIANKSPSIFSPPFIPISQAKQKDISTEKRNVLNVVNKSLTCEGDGVISPGACLDKPRCTDRGKINVGSKEKRQKDKDGKRVQFAIGDPTSDKENACSHKNRKNYREHRPSSLNIPDKARRSQGSEVGNEGVDNIPSISRHDESNAGVVEKRRPHEKSKNRKCNAPQVGIEERLDFTGSAVKRREGKQKIRSSKGVSDNRKCKGNLISGGVLIFPSKLKRSDRNAPSQPHPTDLAYSDLGRPTPHNTWDEDDGSDLSSVSSVSRRDTLQKPQQSFFVSKFAMAVQAKLSDCLAPRHHSP